MEENTLDDQVGQQMMIQMALAAMPDLPKMYPNIIGIVDMFDGGIDSYLGDNDKMVVLSKISGKTYALILDRKIPFTINQNFEVETDTGISPILKTYEKSEWKNKLLNSSALQTLKDRYEKLSPEEATAQTEGAMGALMNLVK